jgi:hypothetical protein
MYTFGIIGLVLISIAVWIKKEKKQDLLFLLGGAFLLVHSLSIHDKIFIILQVVFMASALVELVKIKKRK